MYHWIMWIRRYLPSHTWKVWIWLQREFLPLTGYFSCFAGIVKNETVSEEFFHELDKPNGGSMVAKVLIEDCTEVHLYVGRQSTVHTRIRGFPLTWVSARIW